MDIEEKYTNTSANRILQSYKFISPSLILQSSMIGCIF